MDPDQTAPIGAVCSGSTLFASILNSSVMLGNYLQQTTSADDIFRCIFLNWDVNVCHLMGLILLFGYVTCLFGRLLPFFKMYILKHFSLILAECQTDMIQIRPDRGLNCLSRGHQRAK